MARAFAVWLALAWPVIALAATDPVVARSGAATVTAHELRLVLQGLPDATRAQVVRSQPAMTELLRSMLLQDLLYATARAAGVDRQPAVALAAERARQSEIVRSYIAQQLPAAAVPDAAQIEAAYEANESHFMQPRQFHLAQIFRAGGQSGAELAALGKQLAEHPEGFADAARARSDDKRSAAAGGDLGWLAQDDLTEPIKSAVAGLPAGGISAPLQTRDGWHLIRMLETRPAGPAALAAVQPTLVQALMTQERQAATRQYLMAQAQREPMTVDQPSLLRALTAP